MSYHSNDQKNRNRWSDEYKERRFLLIASIVMLILCLTFPFVLKSFISKSKDSNETKTSAKSTDGTVSPATTEVTLKTTEPTADPAPTEQQIPKTTSTQVSNVDDQQVVPGYASKTDQTDEAYVYRYIVSHEDIPSDNKMALALRDECLKVLDTCINDRMTDYEKEVALHDYIVNMCVYSHGTSGNEYSAYGVLVEHEAVCEGYAKAMNLLLWCCGIESKCLSGTSSSRMNNGSSGDSGHMWNQVKIDGEWYHLDVTWDDPVGDEQRLMHTYLNVPDSIMNRDHDWSGNMAEKCTSMNANFFRDKGTLFRDSESVKSYLKKQIKDGIRDEIEFGVMDFELDDNSEMFDSLFDEGEISGFTYYYTGPKGYNGIKIDVR